MEYLSHTDAQGRARMVDVGDKDIVRRNAKARGFITLSKEALKLVRENAIKKGDVMAVAEIAGVQAAKATSGLIPLAHNIAIDRALVMTKIEENGISAEAEVSATGRTGVEMEALTAVSIALLTIYDMCKAVDGHMEISSIRLMEKTKTAITV
jgi:cyclic pyranopterin phosphate synthase